jgi:hypothetical protein
VPGDGDLPRSSVLVSTSHGDDPWSEMPREKAAALRRAYRVAEQARFQRIQVFLPIRTPAV